MPEHSAKRRKLEQESSRSTHYASTPSASVTTTPTKTRPGVTPKKGINGSDVKTPVKRKVMEMEEEIAEKKEKGMITRGRQRVRLAMGFAPEEEESEEDGEVEDIEDNDDNENEEDEEDEEDDEEEEAEEGEEVDSLRPTVSTTYEHFFQHSARRQKKVTSDNTLALLPTLTAQESSALLASIPDHHQQGIQNLHDSHRAQFPQWKFEIDNGYNILLYGYGSKRSIIESFGQEQLSNDMPVLVINGYYPTISLDSIIVQILELVAPKVSVVGVDKLHLIQQHLSEPIGILVHSLDSPVLRLPKNQQILSSLAAHKCIHMVASIDHINAALLFDSLKSSRYNFVWHNCTTFTPYRTELSFDSQTFIAGSTSATSSVGGLQGIKAVLNNLTPNARWLYLSLLQHQVPLHDEESASHLVGGPDQGISFPQLRQLCMKTVLPLANPMALKGVLAEFFDHGLLERNDGRGAGAARKGRGGGDIMWAPFDKNLIKQVIEFLENN